MAVHVHSAERDINGKGELALNSYADVWAAVVARLRTKLSDTTVNT